MAAPDRFRELTHLIRGCAVAAAKSLPIERGSSTRMLIVALTLAMFVAASGAFRTSDISPDVRYPVIAGLTVLVLVIDLAIRAALERWLRFGLPPLRLTIRMLVFLPCTILVCWGMARLFEGPYGTPPVSDFVLPVLIFGAAAAAFGAVTKVWRTPSTVLHRDRPTFVDLLPRQLQSAEIIAVEGEDHYVLVHTSLGRHLLLMRFRDALNDLRGLDGHQTHRSWWVAKSAVSAVKRGNGRATLTLANGVEAPVSRRYAQGLRERGWY